MVILCISASEIVFLIFDIKCDMFGEKGHICFNSQSTPKKSIAVLNRFIFNKTFEDCKKCRSIINFTIQIAECVKKT